MQVCECVVILKNLKEVSWAGAKSMMADTGFLKGLVEFDKDSLSEKQALALCVTCYAYHTYITTYSMTLTCEKLQHADCPQ